MIVLIAILAITAIVCFAITTSMSKKLDPKNEYERDIKKNG